MKKDLDFTRIHRFVFDDLHIMLDVNSGSVHVTDQAVDAFLDALEEGQAWDDAIATTAKAYGEEDAKDIAEGIEALIDEGMLFSDVDFADYVPHTQPIVKAMCLHMAHDCNLRCGYCFADTGAYGGGRSLMSLEVGKKAIDFLMEASKHRTHVEIDFFGGEPLLNMDVCKQVAAYAKEKAAEKGKIVKMTMTTNGVLLDDECAKWLNEE